MEKKLIEYSREFYERGAHYLELFDEGDQSALFHAALEFRFAFEARAYEYLRAAYKQSGKQLPRKVKEYRPEQLFRRLMKIQAFSDRPSRMAFGRGGHIMFTAEYVPITSEIVRQHERLGDLLHYTFFVSRSGWFYDELPVQEWPVRTLADARCFLGEVSRSLDELTSGNLLAHPSVSGPEPHR